MNATDLAGRIARHVRRDGPISVAAFMAMALHDPQSGYYARRNPLGRSGDFVTAPEISQIFGELIGLWCAEQWRRIGAPQPFLLAELGPGRGTLMADLLRAAETVPAFRRAVRLCLVEVSPALRAEQQRRLANADPLFFENVEQLPPGPLLIVGNEFLDALPIRQLVRGHSEWAERLVGLDAEHRLTFVSGTESPALTLLVPPPFRAEPPGTIVEICPVATAVAARLGVRFAHSPGAALFIDYGHFPRPARPTLSAVRQHQPEDVLENIGAADLSAHVDFALLAEAAHSAGAAVWGPVPQGQFLVSLGAKMRLAALSARANRAQRALLESGLRRLIDPEEMGSLFKVMAITSPGTSPRLLVPAGFSDTADSGST